MRTADEWRAYGARPEAARTLSLFPFLGISSLISQGHATELEVALIRSIAAGSAEHPLLTQERARRILLDDSAR